jgi:hypothetical protein
MKPTKFCAYEQTAHMKFTHYNLRYKCCIFKQPECYKQITCNCSIKHCLTQAIWGYITMCSWRPSVYNCYKWYNVQPYIYSPNLHHINNTLEQWVQSKCAWEHGHRLSSCYDCTRDLNDNSCFYTKHTWCLQNKQHKFCKNGMIFFFSMDFETVHQCYDVIKEIYFWLAAQWILLWTLL